METAKEMLFLFPSILASHVLFIFIYFFLHLPMPNRDLEGEKQI
jgi:trehalose-6-phosphate synthase